MLSKREEKFIEWWEQNREKERKTMRQLYIGLPVGLGFGIAILALLGSGWFERATMVANSQVNPNVLTIAVAAIGVFIAIFYKKYKWDMYEQQYRELMAKKHAAEKAAQRPQEQSL
ncbi:hypothetical protein SAMN05421788_10314 [Filimonas lacunae]|uniref:Uncharacterized protein n=1 Tax=Filimonas lacunae TaxID=477680 RepID=A0A173MJ71_9BACT|nr:hypothetical protein [Filimonas lacunae]BAV07664.1 hypothetical protein FLA_3695 [Filimonas lacunae]SIT03195.1 hypothetical protein SAMN05421788_10314 [Filimonas lacunae]